jgi:superfamily I DNA and/or RNA helicase
MDVTDTQLRWRLDKLGNRNSYARQIDAIKNLTMSLEGCSQERRKFSPHPVLRDMLLKPTNEIIPKKISTANINITKNKARVFQSALEGELQKLLNDSQLGALQHAVNKRCTLVQGPPGTGKTHTAVQILVQMVKNKLVPLPLLATSDSNIAVDNLLEGITAHGIKAIRVGRPENIREDLLSYSLDEMNRSTGKASRTQSQRILQQAEVICATCIGSGSEMLSKYAFHTVLIDECTQATETSVLVPISRGCQQLILVGDHCQLPPTVISDVAMEKGLAVSLFSRLADQKVQPVLLNTQYRMHPLIAEFPSDSFYKGRLKTGVAFRERLPPRGFPWPQMGTPVAFLDSSGPERVEGHSYTNETEIKKAIWALEQMLIREDPLLPGGPLDIGVITPYSSQSRLLKRSLRRPRLKALGLNRIEVSTVDGFQGREKEVIIFTAVRSNETGKVGFLDKWRRMNVMMTRPRRGLIIIGNRKTLRCDRRWGKWLQWAASAGVIFNERASGRYVPTFLGDTLVGESEEIEKLDSTSVVETKSVNDALPQAFLDAQKDITSEMWDSTASPINSPKIKQWTPDEDGDDDWDDMYSDDEGADSKVANETKEGSSGVDEKMEKISLAE